MKKRLLALLLAVVLTVSCLPHVVLAEGVQSEEQEQETTLGLVEETTTEAAVEETAAEAVVVPEPHSHSDAHVCEDCEDNTVTWTKWEKTNELPTTTGHYYLTVDVKVSAYADVKNTTDIVLCLNGYTVDAQQKCCIYRITGNAKVTILDCTAYTDADGNYVAGALTGGKEQDRGAMIHIDNNAVFQMFAGKLTNGKNTQTSSSMGYSGGAIHGRGNSVITLKNCEISGNSTSAEGGAICLRETNATGDTAATLYCENVTFKGNVADRKAGVLFLNNKKNSATFKNCTFVENVSKGSGGAIYSNYGNVTVEDCIFQGNYCGTGGGGAINMAGGRLEITGTTFDGTNSAGKDNATNGGAVYLGAASDANVKNSTFTSHKVSNLGSVVFIKESNTRLIMESGEISGNTGKNGTVYVQIGGTFKMTGGVIKNNTVTGKGGGIYINGDGANGYIDAGEITGNSANYGGAVYLENAKNTLHLRGGKLNNNTATSWGGGIYCSTSATLKTKGTPEVMGNTVGGSANNVTLGTQAVITMDEMGEGTGKIGLTIDGSSIPRYVSTDMGGKDYSAYFFSDHPYREITSKDGKLYVQNATNHKHCECINIGGEYCDHTTNVWIAWEKKDSLPTTSGYYFLTANVNTTGRQSVKEGADVHLCLNGYTVNGNNKCIYEVVQTGKLTLTDCTAHTDEEGNYVAGALTGGKETSVGGAVYVKENGEARIFGIKLTGNKNTQTDTATGWSGGAIQVRNNGKLLMVGAELSDNHTTAEGGAVCLRDSGQAVLENCTFRNNVADRKGGAIYLTGKNNTLSLKNCVFEGNQVVADAGGAFMNNGAPVTVTGCTFTDNTAGGNGGAIMMYGGTLNLENSTFTGNTGKEGGAVRFTVGCEVKITNCIMTGNHATVSAGAISSADTNLMLENNQINENISDGTAGAVFFAGKDRVLTLVSGEFKGNTSAAAGGAILVQSRAKMDMKDGILVGNTSTGGDGGAIYISTNCSMVMDKGEIKDNAAKGYGGGIMLFGSSLTINDGIVSNNTSDNGAGVTGRPGIRTVDGQQIRDVAVTFTMNKGTISENNASVSGGGVLINGKGSTFTMNGGTVANNKSDNGGGIIAMSEAVIQLKNGTVIGNEALRNGGGIYISYTASLVQDGGEISKNSAGNNGGGVYVYGGSFTLNEGKLTGNYAKNYGGAIRTDGPTQNKVEYTGQLTIKSGTISGNTAGHSGAGVAARNTQFLLEGGTITGNYSNQSAGGILLLAGAELKMTGGSITGNNTGAHAGGIFCSNDSKITMTGGSVSYNTCQKNGGGVFLMAAKGYFYGGSISGNDAGGQGGGVNVSGSEVILGGVYITNNHSKVNAGGVASARYDKTMPRLTITGGVISGNKTDGQGGGMVIMSAGQTWMKGGIIEKNESAGNGGGIYVSTNHTFEMSGGEIRNNKANQGAGVYHLASFGTYTGGKITGNVAVKNGGGMVMTGASNVTMKDFTITDNSGWTGGGFILNNQDVKFTAEDCDISRNKAAEGHAGAFYIVWGVTDALLKNCTITDNYAKQDGGAIYQANGNLLTLTDCTLTGNTAGREGGAIWTKSPTHLTNCTISKNTAGGNGGGICTGPMGASNIRRPIIMLLENCAMENNASGAQGGGVYVISGSWFEAKGLEMKSNTSKMEGGAIWTNDNVLLTNATVTNNVSQNGGYALYYGDAEFDGFSYFRGLYKIGGQMVVKDNQGGDLYLGEQTTMSINANGLTGESYMNIKLASGLLTQRLYGTYDYEGSNCDYIVTTGEKSQMTPEFDASMLPQEEIPEEPTEAPTTGENEQNTDKKVSPVILIAGGAIAAVIAAVAIIIVAVSKKKKTVSDK